MPMPHTAFGGTLGGRVEMLLASNCGPTDYQPSFNLGAICTQSEIEMNGLCADKKMKVLYCICALVVADLESCLNLVL
jgi:hypothetical protein